MVEGLHTVRVGTLLRHPPLTCAPDAYVGDVAALMGRAHARAAVVLDERGHAAGIVTDGDLRAKVVALRRDAGTTTARDVMSAPVVTIDASAFAFEALLEMTRREIHHLVVLDDARPVGMLTSDDLVALPATHPVLLARAINAADSLDALKALAGRVTDLVRRLVEDSRARDIAAIVAELNDRLVARVLALAEAATSSRRNAAAPAAWAWLFFGSEGRREQTLRTDQDNGLVYADDAGAAAPDWFADLARAAIDGLVTVGFPPCPGGAMASNPTWCQPVSVWEGYFRDWLERPTAQHVLHASMYFDVRPLADGDPLATRLRELVQREAPAHRHFLSAMARDVADRQLPKTLFGRIKVDRTGAVDLKGAGSLQLVGAARVHALALGLAETGTVARFRGAAAAGAVGEPEVTEIVDAFDHLLHVRLVAQLEGRGNRIDPTRLSQRDRLLLVSAFDTVERVQRELRDRFRTDLMA